jgi:hydrogenase maturation protease
MRATCGCSDAAHPSGVEAEAPAHGDGLHLHPHRRRAPWALAARGGGRTVNVLVAGVGNVFFGDDGFGVEVVRRLRAGPVPPTVEVEDFGLRGVHLAYRLADGASLVVLVDAVRRGGVPGTLYVIEPDASPLGAGPAYDAHAVDLGGVLETARALGVALPPVRIVGCEPASVEVGVGLSAPVERAVEPAADLVRTLFRPYAPEVRP